VSTRFHTYPCFGFIANLSFKTVLCSQESHKRALRTIRFLRFAGIIQSLAGKNR